MKRTAPPRRPDSLLSRLNPAQREAVSTTEGPLLVLAGAGTGKTRVITYRIAHLLQKGAEPESILAVTFTNKAAREMKERVRNLAGKRADGVILSTFHSLGVRVLRAHARVLGYRSRFNIYDGSDQVALLRTILRDIRSSSSVPSPRAVLAEISRAKCRFLLPGEYVDSVGDEGDWEALVARAYERYQESLQDMNCVDFDDLILLPVRLLENHEEVAETYRRRFRHILVDEYQDTSGAQHRFLRGLLGPHRNLCVVGDDDQAIYGFRGADSTRILRFEREFPQTTVVKLEENYRSTQAILDLANAVISGSAERHEKSLRSRLGKGIPVRCIVAGDEIEEVDCILGEIRELQRRGVPPDSIAILIRGVHQAQPFEERLRLRRIPYTLVGGQSYFDRKEVRDVLAYWMAASNPRDDLSLLRIINAPRRGFGSVTIRKLDALARSRRSSILQVLPGVRDGEGEFPRSMRRAAGHLVDLFARAQERLSHRKHAAMARGIVAESSYAEVLTELYHDPQTRRSRWAAVEELFQAVERWEEQGGSGDFEEFLEALRLDQQDPRESDGTSRRRGIRLMTLHSSKGLEFSHVFLPGVEEEILPHRKAEEDGEKGIEEERRLFYVGITRARESLTLTRASTRDLRGRRVERKASRFLEELAGRGLFDADTFDPHLEASEEEVEDFLHQFRSLRGQDAEDTPRQST